MDILLANAINFASVAHKGQTRKFTEEPYINHCIRTALILLEITTIEDRIIDYIAAILHDTVEDTQTSINEIKKEFGIVVGRLVEELTNNSKEIKAIGKTKYLINKFNTMSSRALTIKIADRADNVASLLNKEVSEDFRNKYVKETKTILDGINVKLNTSQLRGIEYIRDSIIKIENTY